MNRNTIVRFFVGCLVLLLLHTPAQSKTITVEQDGTGDFTSIVEALTEVRSIRDVIIVGPGVYTGLLYVDCSVTIMSSGGPEATILDGEGSDRVMIFLRPAGKPGKKAPTVEVIGFTLANGYADNNGGAVRVTEGSHVTMRDCIFRDNVSTYDGAAIFMRHDGSSLALSDCEFIDNYGRLTGAVTTIEDTYLDVDRCIFIGNTTDYRAACLYAWTSTMTVTNSVFMNNVSLDLSGGICYSNCGDNVGVVRNNTFYGNNSPGNNGGSVIVMGTYGVKVTGNIIAGEQSGYGLYTDGDHTCNLFWDNELSDLHPFIDPDPTEIFDDPLFCDPESGDLSIAYESHAAPANNDCGVLIGALEPACHIIEAAPEQPAMGHGALEELALHQNSPNPFNPSTRITYYLPEAARVTIDIYDVQGRLVSRLVDCLEARGEHAVEWNGRNSFGRPAESGLYFCRLKMGKEILNRKMLLLR